MIYGKQYIGYSWLSGKKKLAIKKCCRSMKQAINLVFHDFQYLIKHDSRATNHGNYKFK